MSLPSTHCRLHRYHSERKLSLFQYLPTPSSAESTPPTPLAPKHTLIFIGGLYDNQLTLPFLPRLAYYLAKYSDWAVAEIQLSSSGVGWGVGSLDQDVEEIAEAVKFLRYGLNVNGSATTTDAPANSNSSEDRRVVLMGHSTGSQDVLHFLHQNPTPGVPQIDGAILQAAVSDREGIADMRRKDPEVEAAYQKALDLSPHHDPLDPRIQNMLLPQELAKHFEWTRPAVSYSRFLSLTSPLSPANPSPDDLFSSDLSDATLAETFGQVGTSGVLKPNRNDSKPSLQVHLGGEDEYTPDWVSQPLLLERWAKALEGGGAVLAPGSGILPGASHTVERPEDALQIVEKVYRYLLSIEGGVDEAAIQEIGEELAVLNKAERNVTES